MQLLVDGEKAFAKLINDGSELSSALHVRKGENKTVYTLEKYDKADTLPLTRFHHIVQYNKNLHEQLQEKYNSYALQLGKASTPDEISYYDLESGRFQHLSYITEYDKTLYHQELDEVPNPLDTSNLDDTSYMFYGCTKLKNVQELDTHESKDMRSMFQSCKSLPEVFPWVIDCASVNDIEKFRDMFKDSSVKRAYFKNAKKKLRDLINKSAKLMGLEYAAFVIPLGGKKYKMKDVHPDTYKTDTEFEGPFGALGVITIEELYDGCESLQKLIPFDTYNIENFERMFRGCKSLPANFPYPIEITNARSVQSLKDMFKDSSVEHAWFETKKPESMLGLTDTILGKKMEIQIDAELYADSYRIQEVFPFTYRGMKAAVLHPTNGVTVDVSLKEPLSDTSRMFENCHNLEVMDSPTVLQIEGAKDMSAMFRGCWKLKEMPAVDTSKSEDLNSMYTECRALSEVKAFDASQAKSVAYMFSGCTGLPKTISFIPDVRRVGYKDGFKQMYGETSVEEISLANVDMTLRNDMTPQWFGDSVKKVRYLATVEWILGDSEVRKATRQDGILFHDAEHCLAEVEHASKVNEIVYDGMDDISATIGADRKLESIGKIAGTENVKNMIGLFSGCKKLVSLPAIDIRSMADAASMKDMLKDTSVTEITFAGASDALKETLTPAVLGNARVEIKYA